MPVSNAKVGAGAGIWISTNTTTVPTDNLQANWESVSDWELVFANPQALALPGATATDIEVTHLLSPNRRREYIAGPLESGSISGTANFAPAEYKDLLSWAGTQYGFCIVVANTGTSDQDTPDPLAIVYFMGHLSLSETPIEFEGVMQTPFTIKIDTDPVVDESPASGDVPAVA